MVHEHIVIAKRWAFHRMQPKESPPPYAESSSRRMVAEGDVLNSYGSHFPLVRLVRTRHGKPSHWLVNGDRWSGGRSQTHSHQADVLRMVQDFKANLGMPYVIVPQSVLDAAGIMSDSVQIVEVTEDWYEQRTEEFASIPETAFWSYEERVLPGTGGWVHRRTGQFVERGWSSIDGRHVYEPPGKPMLQLAGSYEERWAEYHRAERRWQLEWEEIPAVFRRTGRRTLMLNRREHHVLEPYERADGAVGYRYSWRRHWLGESLIRAQVPYQGMFRCHTCRGTGVHPHVEPLPQAEGPLSQRLDSYWRRWNEGASWERADWPDPEPRYAVGSHIVQRCETCEGAKRIRRSRMRWAYFLSGFDHNEPRPSYFFTELPPDARPTSIAEAYAALKPATVRLAEEMGRTVHRQGDQFFIEMPGLTLRELKRMGGVHVKRSQGLVKQLWERDTTDMDEYQRRWHRPPRFQRLINEDCWLHGTTHEATEVVRVGGAVYARGVIRHVPERRTPDHVRLKLGSTWHLNVPNRTPVGV